MGIKEQRTKLGITQEKLAEISGVNFQMVKAYENGAKDINGAKLLTLLKLCDALNCGLEDIVTDVETLAYLRNIKRRRTIKYNLYKNTCEIKNRHEIVQGCTLDSDGYEPHLIKSFDSKADALKEIKQYKTSVQELSYNLYRVTEYYIEENLYDEDEWVGGGDIWGISKFDEHAKKLVKEF